MWIQQRLKRFKKNWRHFSVYLRTLSNANAIERLTDLSNAKTPVLLLYGFGATRRSLSILESRLRKDQFDVFSLNLGGFLDLFNTDPIDGLAHQVAEKVEKLCRRYRLPRISIIGYSKGGLIGRYYVTQLGGHKRVHTLITLATPHQGNPWAFIANLFLFGFLSKGLRQMRPGSPLLKRLNDSPHPENVYLVSIASSRDKQCPPRYCKLSHKNGTTVYNVDLPHLHHSEFIMKQKAYAEIKKHLRAGLHRYQS